MALSLGGVYGRLNVLSLVLCCQLILSGLTSAATDDSPTETTTAPSTTTTTAQTPSSVSITHTLSTTLSAPDINNTEAMNASTNATVIRTTPLINSTPSGEYFQSSTSESFHTDHSNGTLPPSSSVGNKSTVSLSNSPTTLTTTVSPVSISDERLTTGEVVGIVVGVLSCGALVVFLIICLRKHFGSRKILAPVTYRRGPNIQTDRAPLTTKDKDPSPPPDGTEDHYFFDDDRRSHPSRPSNLVTKVRHLHEAEEASLDGDVTAARDGGDDDYFYDEIFGDSAFTDEITNTSIKELSTPVDEEIPDLIFRDDDDDDDFL